MSKELPAGYPDQTPAQAANGKPDPLDQVRAERDAAIAELGHRSDRLADRLLELHDEEALKRFDDILVSIQAVVAKQEDAWMAFFRSIDRIHDAELRLLGSDRQDAARRVLEAMGPKTNAGSTAPWPNT